MSLNEADTRAKLIDPALHGRGWNEELIGRESTAGRIEIVGGRARRGGQRTDYTLRIKISPSSHPVTVAVIEAKPEDKPATQGLEQAKKYCGNLNVPFAFSSNGHLFTEFDASTGRTGGERCMSEFPTPKELRSRYEKWAGFALDSEEAKPLLVPYAKGESSRRYYQDAAIRAALQKIARGEKRILLSLATGSGKTLIAVNLMNRIANAGRMKRALFVCDRDELRSQALGAFRELFGSDAAEARRANDGSNTAKNARIHIATYQTLGVDTEDGDASFLTGHYPQDCFSHIIIDECHRSAWGRWSQILTRNPNAVQIGLTATPRELKEISNSETEGDSKITANNLEYFGDPVYEYTVGQGIEDGYLAACEIVARDIALDGYAERKGIGREDIRSKKITDPKTGKGVAVEDVEAPYTGADFEKYIEMPERVDEMCRDLFCQMENDEETGPEQKTIIFCASDRHADLVAARMNNIYAIRCEAAGRKPPAVPYAFKCTAASGGGSFLPDFRGSSKRHFIAATVELLTTGVDIPCVRNVVFFRYVQSPIAFYQMVGRGTRIHYETGKMMFRVFDYTNATRLFGKDLKSSWRPPGKVGEPSVPQQVVRVEGFDVRITPAGHLILTQVDSESKMVPIEEYERMVVARLKELAPTSGLFREKWISPEMRKEMVSGLPDGGRSASLIRSLRKMTDYDLYDTLAEIGYGLAPHTRANRAEAFGYKNGDWLDSMAQDTSATVRAIAEQFAEGGTEELENPGIFRTPKVSKAGGIDALSRFGKPSEIVLETKRRMFEA